MSKQQATLALSSARAEDLATESRIPTLGPQPFLPKQVDCCVNPATCRTRRTQPQDGCSPPTHTNCHTQTFWLSKKRSVNSLYFTRTIVPYLSSPCPPLGYRCDSRDKLGSRPLGTRPPGRSGSPRQSVPARRPRPPVCSWGHSTTSAAEPRSAPGMLRNTVYGFVSKTAFLFPG